VVGTFGLFSGLLFFASIGLLAVGGVREHRRHDKSGLALIIFAVVAIVFSYTGFAFFATIYERTLCD
jgi:hypothetical protein